MTVPANACRPTTSNSLPIPPALLASTDPALFLDFDGTLVDIAPHPDAIEIAAGLPDILARLNENLGGRLAIITGRALSDIDRHLDIPDVAMAGSHGGEFRATGSGEIVPLADPFPGEIEAKLRKLANSLGGLLVEAKPFSAAIHYRGRPEAETEVIERAAKLAEAAGMTLKRGKMVAELMMPGLDKGSAVDRFMQMPGFTSARPIFVGDDITDEDAFRSVLDHGGSGILVGPKRQTAAQWRLPNVLDVHHWLKAALP